MNWRIFSICFTFVLTLTASPLLLADGDETGIAHRVAALEQQMTTLMAEQERVSPDTDLPAMTMTPQDDGTDVGIGTYTVVGNRLTVTHSNEGESDSLDFLMTPDGQVLVFIEFGLENDGAVQTWNVGTAVGVQATSCDL